MQGTRAYEAEAWDSQNDYSQQINDKLNDLWTQMKHKKNQIIKTITPGYSRKTEGEEGSRFSQNKSKEIDRIVSAETEVMKLRQKLASEVSISKQKQVEIESLRRQVAQLTNDKKQLILQIHQSSDGSAPAFQQVMDQDNSKLNESSIRKIEASKAQSEPNDSDKDRLLELLRSTQQYRQFVFYYDNNELSYLRTLSKMRRRNCQCNPSEREMANWAPREVIEMVEQLSSKHNMGLKRQDVQKIVHNVNLVYSQRQKAKISQMKAEHERRVRQLERQANHSIPYEIVQIQKQKERELTAKRKKRVNSVTQYK